VRWQLAPQQSAPEGRGGARLAPTTKGSSAGYGRRQQHGRGVRLKGEDQTSIIICTNLKHWKSEKIPEVT
jgi:hypothetical protein